MRTAVVLVLALLVATADPAGAVPCDPEGPDAAAIAAARADIAAQCNCATAASHGAYTSCAAGLVAAHGLSRPCAGYVKKCAARSTCGRPGFVTCCKTNRKGKKTCAVKRDAAHCKAPNGGTAVASDVASCCDACTTGGGPTCGNSVVEQGETCDEPSGFPSAACPHPDGKLRCARAGEADACDRCCGRSVGDGAGYICLSAGDTACCGFCAQFETGHRCADCKDAACSCGTLGDACNETSCCAGYACRTPGTGNFTFGTCCGSAGTGCGSGGDCCSGTCTAGVCE